jgi:PPOX class probable F420-dependent enzyme
MASLADAGIQSLLGSPNHAVLTTINEDGSLTSSVVWIDQDDDTHLAVNGATGRRWPENLARNPTLAVLVINQENPFEYVEVRGKAEGPITDGADAHIDRLAKKYLGQDVYPWHNDQEQRLKFRIAPETIRYQKQ